MSRPRSASSLALPLAADLGLDLDVDRVGGELGDLGVGVLAVEVAGVEVHAEVGRRRPP